MVVLLSELIDTLEIQNKNFHTYVLFFFVVSFVYLISVKSHNALVKHLKLMQNHEDFELKKLLFNILISLSKDSTVIPVSNYTKECLCKGCLQLVL